nr:uncharacterized protein LOC115265091 [Aedes albopictus]
MAAHCNEHNSSQLQSAQTVESDVLKEVKSLARAINTLDTNICNARFSSSTKPPSLMDELAQTSVEMDLAQSQNAEKSGWRKLGSKNVWRSDWTDYDARQQRRENQQKAKDKARRRRKARRQRHSSSKISKDKRENTPSCSYFNYNNDSVRQPATTFLPPDKDLLAAAKVTFSKPPVKKQHGIRFQKGETLNPYPVDDQFPQTSPTPTSNWTFGPALRNSFSQHCTSCSCERSCFPTI